MKLTRKNVENAKQVLILKHIQPNAQPVLKDIFHLKVQSNAKYVLQVLKKKIIHNVKNVQKVFMLHILAQYIALIAL